MQNLKRLHRYDDEVVALNLNYCAHLGTKWQ